VIDYIFRDLAISYLKRSDLGQVKPEDLLSTATKNEMDSGEARQPFAGKQSAGFRPGSSGGAPANTSASAAGSAQGGQKAAGLSSLASQGTPRSDSHAAESPKGESLKSESPKSDSPKGESPRGLVNAAKGSAEGASGYSGPSSPAMQPRAQVLEQPRTAEQSRPEQSEVVKIAQARIKGYEGDPCSNCGFFTLVRNGTCMKCHTCGSTTGCS